MLIRKAAEAFKLGALALGCATASIGAAAPGFHLEKDAQGLVRPFKAVAVPLADFVREYARVAGKAITSEGNPDEELKGSVTLFLKRPLSEVALTEVFFRVIADNAYAVVDASAGNGWVLQRSRDARDQAIPVYEASEVPDSARVVTVHMELKHADPETVARMMRSFMPAASRIIPVSGGSQLFITDTASNVRRLNWLIARMDTPEAAKRHRESNSPSVPQRSCGEQRIEKLVVEKLEIQDGGLGGPPQPRPAPQKKGGRQ